MTKPQKIKNTWRKTKPLGESYVTLTDHRTAYVYKVRKLYSDPRKPYARAFCSVTSPHTIGEHGDLGDVYCAEIPGLVAAWLKAHTPVEEPCKPMTVGALLQFKNRGSR